jgi:hypothetical protein
LRHKVRNERGNREEIKKKVEEIPRKKKEIG